MYTRRHKFSYPSPKFWFLVMWYNAVPKHYKAAKTFARQTLQSPWEMAHGLWTVWKGIDSTSIVCFGLGCPHFLAKIGGHQKKPPHLGLFCPLTHKRPSLKFSTFVRAPISRGRGVGGRQCTTLLGVPTYIIHLPIWVPNWGRRTGTNSTKNQKLGGGYENLWRRVYIYT